eukprot:gene9319-12555_t
MDDDGDDRLSKGRQDVANNGPAVGPIMLLWEASIEKLKILNYERDYCVKFGKKPFHRVQFVIPGVNPVVQFDDFIGISSWLIGDISKRSDLFKREEFDDPNIVINKLMYALSKIDPDFRLTVPNQKLKLAHGEAVCSVLDFLTDKALSNRGFQWATPVHVAGDEIEQTEPADDADDVEIEDDLLGAIAEEEILYEENNRFEASLDNSTLNILQQYQDPIEWKTELERVGPRLRANQETISNEWRSHVDQTVTSKSQIEKVLDETQGSLQNMNRNVSEELTRMKQKEKYLNNQYNALSLEFTE